VNGKQQVTLFQAIQALIKARCQIKDNIAPDVQCDLFLNTLNKYCSE
jgi:hypothetical protein